LIKEGDNMDKFERYIQGAMCYSKEIQTLAGMVVLHFDIEYREAEDKVIAYMLKYNPSLITAE